MFRRWGVLPVSSKGMALASAAVTLPLVSVLLAFVVDIGLAGIAQSRLEAAVNDAADVAARRLPDEVGAASAAQTLMAWSLADVETFGTTPVVSVSTGPDTITVEASMEARVFFGGLVGSDGYAVSARARRAVVPTP